MRTFKRRIFSEPPIVTLVALTISCIITAPINSFADDDLPVAPDNPTRADCQDLYQAYRGMIQRVSDQSFACARTSRLGQGPGCNGAIETTWIDCTDYHLQLCESGHDH